MAQSTGGFLVFLALITGSYSMAAMSLNGASWRVKGAPEYDLPATVPGGIYSDLMDNGIIPDIFFGSGDTDYRWVGSQDWTYYTSFDVDQDVMEHVFVNLVFDGLDTFATIFVNGNQVGSSQNMFVQYVYPIKDYIWAGSNYIEVVFQSSVNVAAGLAANAEYSVPPDCPAEPQNGVCHVNQIRKMQASYSWDWGPAFPSIGIWKDVSIEAFDTAVIRYLTADTIKQDDGTWLVNVETYFDAGTNGGVQGQLALSLTNDHDGISDTVPIDVTTNENNEIVTRTTWTVNENDITLWWPNGYGSHTLYTLTASFPADNPTTSKQIQIGYRTVLLVQDEVEGGGLTFYFRVNGVPIFAKGANEIPVHILPEKGQDPAKVTELLGSAAEANMNMLRVWGGGVYESDFFYAEADRLGILIWQDMMFACALYPSSPEYLDNVRQEVHHQVLRLKHHPSIAVFAGNNEDEQGLWESWYSSADQFDFYRGEYIKLFIDVIGAEIWRLAPQNIFLSSSPSDGDANKDEFILTNDPQWADYGDMHVYDYVKDSWDYRTFPVTRFASEFGYQSLPRLDAWRTATHAEDDLNPDGAFVNHRQHHPDGAKQNNDQIAMQLQLPGNDGTVSYDASYVYLSQVVQAMAYKIQVEHYRSYTQRINADGRGYTMGALYWQLNDVWVAPTWSSIDSTGQWKIVHYYAKNFFAPNLVTGKIDDDGLLRIYAVMDTAVEQEPAPKIRLQVRRYDSFDVASSQDISDFAVISYTATEAVNLDAGALLTGSGCGADFAEASANCYFYFQMLDPDDNLMAPVNWLFPAKPKNSNLQRPQALYIYDVRRLDDEGYRFEIDVLTNLPTLFVWLDPHYSITGRFSDNGFIVISNITTVTFTSKIKVTPSELHSSITITYYFPT